MNYSKLEGSPEEMERLRVTLAKESQAMLECFSRFVTDVSKLLTAESITTDIIKLSLESRLGSYDVTDDIMRKIDSATNIPVLLRTAMPFSSWYNHGLIAFLANEHGCEGGRKLTADYEAKLNSYLRRCVYQCPPLSNLPSGRLSSDFDQLIVKVDRPFKKCTLQDISIFKSRLCDAIGHKDPCCLIVKSVDEGCVKITYIIPSCQTAALASKVEQAIDELNRAGFISVQVGEKVIFTVQQVLLIMWSLVYSICCHVSSSIFSSTILQITNCYNAYYHG